MKVLFLVPDGVGVRNYLYSDVIQELVDQGTTIQLYHKVSLAAIEEIQKTNNSIAVHKEMPTFIESSLPRLLRETSAYARLFYFSKKLKNDTILDFWAVRPKSIKQKTLYWIAEFLGKRTARSYSLMRRLEKLYEIEIAKSPLYKEFVNDLKEFQPDIILNLHQRASITAPVIIAAAALGIKTSTVIFSWDNIPKGRLISRPDFYFVWSKLMKKELCFLYPEIIKEDVFIVGSPQFEFYKKEQFQMPKSIFFEKYGLNVNKKTICYSGDDTATSPYDQLFLNDLCEAVLQLAEEERPQIIFRRCPVDLTNRFDKVLKKYSNLIIVINPDWRIENKSDKNSFNMIYPAYNDLTVLVNTCFHADLVINLGSTMAHDFAVFDKPCLYLNYNPKIDKNWSVEHIYKFEHFRSMKNLDAVGWINNKSEFLPKITKALRSPNEIGTERKKWLEKIIMHPLENNSKELTKVILNKCTSVS
jgi:hypothetical protein